MSSARDFVYLRHHKQVDEEKDIWCDVYQSIEHYKYPEFKNRTRGVIIRSGFYVQPIKNLRKDSKYGEIAENYDDNYCLVVNYSEINY